MANWNPLTNAVGSGGATGHNQYYNIPPSNFGEYGFIYLQEVIDNFVATYTGVGKINATYELAAELFLMRRISHLPELVINVGTAGSREGQESLVFNIIYSF